MQIFYKLKFQDQNQAIKEGKFSEPPTIAYVESIAKKKTI